MKKLQARFAVLTLLLLCITLLAACGDSPTVASPTATTAAPKTTAVAATTTAGSSAATASATTQVAATTAPVGTPVQSGVATAPAGAITIPAGSTFPASLDIYRKVLEATGKVKSYKFNLSGAGVKFEGVLVKPDKVSGLLDAGGVKGSIILIGKDFYVSPDGKTWTKAATDSSINDLLTRLNDIFPQNLAGSVFTTQPDEKLDNKDVGVFMLDTAFAPGAGPDIAKTKLTFKYDKTTFLVMQVTVKNAQGGDADIRYSDYDSAANKVDAPV